MKEAFVLVRCEAGREAYVIRELQKIEQVTEIQPIIGEYDLLVKLEMSNGSETYKIANKKILDVDKVRSIEVLASMARE